MEKQSCFSYENIKSALFGVAVGDALGVPVEFKSREFLKKNPLSDMLGYGTHNVPPGTWSDDTSMTLCLAESLSRGYNLNDLSMEFLQWFFENKHTPIPEIGVFDFGNTTQNAMMRLRSGISPEHAGDSDEKSNGNGSLMRILPLLFEIYDKPFEERFRLTQEVSSLTHRHIRSITACFYYLEFARLLLKTKDLFQIYRTVKNLFFQPAFIKLVADNEISYFSNLLRENIFDFPEEKIQSGGYVVHTLEAAIWSLMTTNSYRSCVLKALNLGNDTDTTAAVAGGLAGLFYGFDAIPKNWIEQIARFEHINSISKLLSGKYTNKQN